MGYSTSTSTEIDSNAIFGSSVLPWISRSLEGLWLSTVLLVPIVFFNQDFAISEAKISYIEIPKVSLLRFLTALMAILWLFEWAIKSNSIEILFPSIRVKALLQPKLWTSIRNWLKASSMRWFLRASLFFFGVTLTSTILSGSFTTSLWGEIPGQDSYSAFTMASYAVLFGVLATHLKSRSQINRLLGALVIMGTIVGLYGIFQHYGHDFLSLTESTGGGSDRVTVFMGNTIFAGAVLSMTLPSTVVAASINLHDENWNHWRLFSRLHRLVTANILTSAWALVITMQLLGLMFTFSRGPWAGSILALLVFMSLITFSLMWTNLIRTASVLGLALVFAIAVLHWNSNIVVINLGAWFGLTLALLGLVGTFGISLIARRSRKTVIILGSVAIAVAITGAITTDTASALLSRGSDATVVEDIKDDSVLLQAKGRLSSINMDSLDDIAEGRLTHWKSSWLLIKDRPWFVFNDLSVVWLRPLIGYGPDLFRYTNLLETPLDNHGFRPIEPDHAHNFFIHQTVEQGILGGLAALTLFVSAATIAGYHLLRKRISADPVFLLLLFGMAAIIIGRFLEMMVGVARISDLTILWVIFGLFVASFNIRNRELNSSGSSQDQTPQLYANKNRTRSVRSPSKHIKSKLGFRLAVAMVLTGVIGTITWQENINYARASVVESQAVKAFQERDWHRAVEKLDKAIALAPRVSFYHNNRAQAFMAYWLQPETMIEPECARQDRIPYHTCLSYEIIQSNLNATAQQPLNLRNWMASGHSAKGLSLHEYAVYFYRTAASMAPTSWEIRVDLAESLIELGRYDESLIELSNSLEITGDSVYSTRALYYKGLALRKAGEIDGLAISTDSLSSARAALKRGLSINPSSPYAQLSLDLLHDIYVELGSLYPHRPMSENVTYFDQIISQDPQDSISHYFRGLARLAMGDSVAAVYDISRSYRDLDLKLPSVRADLGYALFESRDSFGLADARIELVKSLQSDPKNALTMSYLSELEMSEGNYAQALTYANNANALDPNLGLPWLVIAKIYSDPNWEHSSDETAQYNLYKSVGSPTNGLYAYNLPTAKLYVQRAGLFANFADYDKAAADLHLASEIDAGIDN